MKGKNVDFSAGGNPFKSEIAANPTANRTLSLPDKNATLAGLDDIATRQPVSDRLSEIVSGFAAAPALAVPRKNAAGTAFEYVVPAEGSSGDLSIIRQSAKPTTRSNGDVLQVGDQWILPGSISATSEWVWNGQYWLSRHVSYARYASAGSITGTLSETNIFEPEPGWGLWLHDAKVSWRTGGAVNDSSSSFTPTVIRRAETAANSNVFSTTTNPTPANTRVTQIIANEFLLDTDALATQVLRFTAPRLGSVAVLAALKMILPLRLVHLS